MITHRRYLSHRTERQESQNRWLTVLSGAVIVIVIIAITAGPSLVRDTSDLASEFSAVPDTQPSTQYHH